jgi:hypothetical protein
LIPSAKRIETIFRRISKVSKDNDHAGYARRDVLAGAGALLGVVAVNSTAAEAQAANGSAAASMTRASPVTSTIASPPANGRIYRTFSQFDFSTESGSAIRQYGGYGVYSSVNGSTLWTSCEIPAGALVRDIEWYVYNNSGTTLQALARVWTAGLGNLFTAVADCPIPSGPAISATRINVPQASQGPFPSGTKLQLGLGTPPDGRVQVNGVRVGFSNGGGRIALRPEYFTAYDSRTQGGIFQAGQTRIIDIPAAIAPSGTVGIIANVQALNGTGDGFLRIYPANANPPTRSLQFAAIKPVVQMLTVALPPTRKIKIFASAPVHVIIQVAGTIA